MDVLIDDTGSVWEPSSGRLRQRFGLQVSRSSLPAFLVRNLGYVRVSISGKSCEVRASPARMKYRAYASVVQLLKDYDLERLSLSTFTDGAWTHVIFREKIKLLNSLHDQMYCGRKRHQDRYIAQPRSMDTLSPREPLWQVFEAWQEASGNLPVDDRADLFDEVLQSKFSVLAVDPTIGKLKFTRMGRGFAVYDPGWCDRMVGMPADEQPDVKYGRQVSNDLRAILLSKEPTLVDVDALISDPSKRSTERWRYTRLALPQRVSRNEYELLAVTLPNPDVDLRV